MSQLLHRFQHAIHSILLLQCFWFHPTVMQLTAGPLMGFLYSSLSITLQIMVWMESLSPAEDFRFFGQAMWAEGKDLLAFQNIPTAESEANALALIGESLARCFRAQWRCYHIIRGLNGLPTVCLKGSRNDRDQLITASATHCREPSDLLTDEQTPLHAYSDISSYSGSLQHTQVEERHWGFLDLPFMH